jgi:hypothetical protein
MKKSLVIHACWAVAVLAAFGLGSKRGAPAAPAAADGTPAERKSRLSTRFADSGSETLSTRRSERGAAPRESSALGRLFGAVAPADGNFDALMDQALRDPNPITRRLAFSKLLESMTAENAGAMREQLVALGADPDQWRDFHYAWGALDGQAAFDHAANSPERDMAIVMTGWAAANPAEAMALLDNLPESMNGQRDELTASVVAGLSDNNRGLATDLVLRLAQQGNQRAGSLMEIVANETLRAEGPEAASRWSESLPDGPLKGTAMGRIADAYVRKDPEAAARWAQTFAGESYAAQAVEQIGGRWARSNPVAAVGWLESLPAGNGQTAGLRNAFGDWEDRDPAAAGQYLMSMPQSPQRDSAISGFATGYAWQNPQVAIAWAQDIRDPALRESSLTRAGQAFYQRDPEAAKTWLADSGLSAKSQEQVLKGRR